MPQVRTVTLPPASFPSGTESSGGLGTSSRRALSRASMGATFCSSALISSRIRRNSSIAGSPFFRAPSLTRSGCSRMKLRLSMTGTQAGEQDHVADRGLVCEDRHQTVDPQAHSAGRWEAVFERGEEVLVHG